MASAVTKMAAPLAADSTPAQQPSQTPTPTTSLTTSRSPSPKPRHNPPPGLGNLGNTCYLNSVVQVLYHILPFREALLAWTPPPHPTFAAELVSALRHVFVSLDAAQAASDELRNSYDSLARSRRTPSPPPTASASRPRPPLTSHIRSPSRSTQLAPADPSCISAPSSSPAQDSHRPSSDQYASRAAPQVTNQEYPPDTFCDDDEGFLGDDEEDPTDAVLDANPEAVSSDGTREGIDFINPQHIISLLRDEQRCTEFDARGQQDAHEFLRFLLDKVNDSVRSTENDVPNTPLQTSDTTYVTDMKDECLDGTGCKSTPPDHETKEAAETQEVPSTSIEAPVTVKSIEKDAPPHLEGNQEMKSEQPERSPASKRRRCGDSEKESDSDTKHADEKEGGRPSDSRPPVDPNPSASGPLSSASTKRPRKRHRPDLVNELFEGKAVTATRCDECESVTERSEQFLDVSLPVEAGRSLAWAWSAQGAREKLNGVNKYSCDTCQTYTEAQRWWQLAELPQVLTVHLKLFAFEGSYPGGGGKVPVAMPCPVSMTFSEWCSTQCPQRNDMYNLTAVIVHEGTGASSGHYYTYICKPEKDGWYIFDDNFVTAVTEADMNERLFTSMRSRRTAYLLFYTHAQ